jgi:hypothetical protein
MKPALEDHIIHSISRPDEQIAPECIADLGIKCDHSMLPAAPNACTSDALSSLFAVRQFDICQLKLCYFRQPKAGLQHDRGVSRLMPDGSAKSFVLRNGEVSTFGVLQRRRNHIGSRITLPVTGVSANLKNDLTAASLRRRVLFVSPCRSRCARNPST